MGRKESLSLDEFALAARKQSSGGDEDRPSNDISTDREPDGTSQTGSDLRQEARKALRRMKRERVKGESCFVNVNLDRATKRRLKLASFTAETSMQAIMEQAIAKYLDDLGL
ncbi:hypothetical protein LB566_27285 [Mesorhizobium sp. CA13]|uniref:hypothetical protein n=1 Tax=unclassified Mesorhizobium TaxID=325217 RepID=UPI00112668E5|nr:MULTISPECIES: hypothetical protein [unclassified Mesorhizobium]MBZ9857494.1 hypothetical protein [Mesorhizobium sp. CA13]MBZ9966699.1 hypothetical protein [Mesorhizobium sp. BR1-1-2]MCA0014863.1 hypothetical protein [Mesorhizobium sp. B294B1A1]MCA0041017.1 hypothetical protein [Mesorhizobium sp. B292B1B]TPM38024.1 hypothetical protein FJ964_29255 [Mesorhizobium sp. B2-3-2]